MKVPDILSCHLEEFVGMNEKMKSTIINLHTMDSDTFTVEKIGEIVNIDTDIVRAVLEEHSLPKYISIFWFESFSKSSRFVLFVCLLFAFILCKNKVCVF